MEVFSGFANTPGQVTRRIREMSENGRLHGFYADAHGIPSGIHNGGSWLLSYATIENSLSYKMGAVILQVCNGGWAASDNPQPVDPRDRLEGRDGGTYEFFYGPHIWEPGVPGDPETITAGGRDLVSGSPNKVFRGMRGPIDPTGANYGGYLSDYACERVVVSTLFRGDKHGTR